MRLDSVTVQKETHLTRSQRGLAPTHIIAIEKMKTLHSRNIAYPVHHVNFLLIGYRQFRCREPVTKKQLPRSPFFLASTVISGVHAVQVEQKKVREKI